MKKEHRRTKHFFSSTWGIFCVLCPPKTPFQCNQVRNPYSIACYPNIQFVRPISVVTVVSSRVRCATLHDLVPQTPSPLWPLIPYSSMNASTHFPPPYELSEFAIIAFKLCLDFDCSTPEPGGGGLLARWNLSLNHPKAPFLSTDALLSIRSSPPWLFIDAFVV